MDPSVLYNSILSNLQVINSFFVFLFRDVAKKSNDKHIASHLRKKAHRISQKVDCYNITLKALEKCLTMCNMTFQEFDNKVFGVDTSEFTITTPLREFKNNDLIPLLIDIPKGKDLLYRLRCNKNKNCGLTIVNLCEAMIILNKPLSCILHEIELNKQGK